MHVCKDARRHAQQVVDILVSADGDIAEEGRLASVMKGAVCADAGFQALDEIVPFFFCTKAVYDDVDEFRR